MKKKKITDQRMVNFFFEVGMLRKIPRAHMQELLTSDLSDNIASHSFRTAVIGWMLAKRAKADAFKVAAICLFHDVAEARSNDHNWVHKRYVQVFEEEITKEQLGGVDDGQLIDLLKEYEGRKSREGCWQRTRIYWNKYYCCGNMNTRAIWRRKGG